MNKIFTKWHYFVVPLLCFLLLSVKLSGADQQERITLNLKKASITQFFKEIEKRSSYKFFYKDSQVENAPEVSVNADNLPLAEILKRVFDKSNLSYEISGNQIVIKQKASVKKMMKITGIVTDKKKEPLPGVAVIVVGTNIGANTNLNGEFSIDVPSDYNDLDFKMIGMVNQKVRLDRRTFYQIILEENATSFSDVVVTGIVTHNSKSFTGNASVYKGDELKTVGRQNIIKSLSILDPTVAIIENSTMGSDPSNMPKIRFRGESSFQGFENIDKSGLTNDPNQPLFILDGYQTTLATIIDLDMNRVESVTVLKDAAAGAIYGSRAANGVIVVKTVQPKEGELRVSYGLNMDFNLPDLSSYNLLNAKENLELYDRLGMYRNDDGTLNPAYNQISRWVAEGVNTDWLAQPVRNSVGYKHSLNLSGGDRRMRYSVDANYSTNPGVMKGSFRNNYGSGVQLSYNLNDKLLFTNRLSVSQTKSKESPYGSYADYTSINSFYPIRDSYGKLYKYYYYQNEYDQPFNVWGTSGNIPVNPLYEASVGNENKGEDLNLNENLAVEWKLLPTLRISGMLNYTKSNETASSFLSPNSATYAEYGDYVGGTNGAQELLKGRYTYAQTAKDYLESNVLATWSKSIDKHFATVSVGTSMSDSKSKLYGFTAQGFGEGDKAEPAYAQGYEKGGAPSNSEGHIRLASFFASGNYAFDSRYLFDFSYRLDGSSQFGTTKKTAPFYSVGIGWNLHNESFIKKLSYINMFKIRGSYGEVGTVNFSPYQARDTYQNTKDDRYDGNIGVTLSALGNQNLRWQSTRSLELGTTIGLFDRLDLSMSYYNRLTSDMVLPVTTPPSVGFSSFIENLGKMKNRGYEISLRAFVVKNSDMSLALFGTVAHNSNKILSISSALESFNKSAESSSGKTENENRIASHKFLTKYEEGKSTTAIYAVRSLGIDPMTGQELFLTKDGNPTLAWIASDKVVVGDTEPVVRGTFGANIGWKGLFLNATFSYSCGGQVYNSTLVDKVENSNKYKNVDKRVLTETWQKPGDIVRYKANVTGRYALSYTYASSRFVQDLNSLQLSSLSVQYELPGKLIRPIHMQSMRLSFNMSDILYSSTVKRERGTSYPFARSFSFGLRTNF